MSIVIKVSLSKCLLIRRWQFLKSELPENPNNFDVVWMETFKQHAREKDAKVLYAGVGLGNPNGEHLPLFLNEEYLIEYNGIQLIETNLN